MTSTVETSSALYITMSKKWGLIDALWGGTATMRDAGITYLPKNEKESNEAWQARRDRTFLSNYFKHSVDGLNGKVFQEDIVKKDFSTQAEAWSENIDLQGNDLTQFSSAGFKDALKYGMTHIFVDMPNTTEIKTVADQRAQNVRPFMVNVSTKDLIGWKFGVVNGIPQLTQIRIKETFPANNSDNVYEDTTITQIKVVNIGSWEIYQQDGSSNYVLVDQGISSLPYIPFFTFYTNKQAFMLATPPLEDLAYLNLRHWQSSSEQNNILHVTRCPFLFGAGFPEGASIEVGVNRLITNSDKDAKMNWVEHSGLGVSAGRQDLLDLEDAMRLMAQGVIIQNTTGEVTATEKVIDTSSSNSILKNWVLGYEDKLNNALKSMADYASVDRETIGNAKLFTDFETVSTQADLNTLYQSRVSGEITQTTYLNELKRRNVLSADLNVEDEINLLEDEEGVETFGDFSE